MKVLILKKTIMATCLAIVIFFTAFLLNWTDVINVGSAYSLTNKKLPIYSVKTEDNKLAISFDAAWGADKTQEIMNICDEYGVKATFFLVGFWVDKYPEMVKEIHNRGFEIGIHSNTHPDMTKLTRRQIKEELSTNIEKVEQLIGVRPKLFRPPYGYYNNNLIEICDSLNLKCIQWDVDSLDWKGLSASELAGRVIKNAKNGSIILCHNNSDNITSGLKLIFEYFKNNNKKLVPIGELIYFDNYTINSQGVQIKN